MNKPDPDEIRAAIASAENGHWLDPSVAPVCWRSELYDDAGVEVGDGAGHTAGEAMAMAWLCAMAPDALLDAYVEEGSVPFEVPDDWRFKLTAPDEVDNGVAVDGRPYLPYPPGEFRRVVEEAIKNNPNAESLTGKIMRAMDGASAGLTVAEVPDAVGKLPPASQHDPDPEAVAEAILQEYRIPLALQQQFIRHGLAAEVTRLLVADRGGET